MSEPPRATATYRDQPDRINAERRRGLVLLAIILPALVGWASVVTWVSGHALGDHPALSRMLAVPFAAGAVTAIVALAKVAFGRTLGELLRTWEELTGGQRFVAGVLVVAFAIVVIVTIVGAAITVMVG